MQTSEDREGEGRLVNGGARNLKLLRLIGLLFRCFQHVQTAMINKYFKKFSFDFITNQFVNAMKFLCKYMMYL